MDIAGVFEYRPENPGPAAQTLCVLVDGASLILFGMNGGTLSVVVITLERYWKIVHPIHHRKRYRRWMLRLGLALPWLNGFASHLLPAIGTTRIVDGVCSPMSVWPSKLLDMVRSSRHHLKFRNGSSAGKKRVTFVAEVERL